MTGHWERTCVPLELEMHSLHRTRAVPVRHEPARSHRVRAKLRNVLSSVLAIVRTSPRDRRPTERPPRR